MLRSLLGAASLGLEAAPAVGCTVHAPDTPAVKPSEFGHARHVADARVSRERGNQLVFDDKGFDLSLHRVLHELARLRPQLRDRRFLGAHVAQVPLPIEDREVEHLEFIAAESAPLTERFPRCRLLRHDFSRQSARAERSRHRLLHGLARKVAASVFARCDSESLPESLREPALRCHADPRPHPIDGKCRLAQQLRGGVHLQAPDHLLRRLSEMAEVLLGQVVRADAGATGEFAHRGHFNEMRLDIALHTHARRCVEPPSDSWSWLHARIDAKRSPGDQHRLPGPQKPQIPSSFADPRSPTKGMDTNQLTDVARSAASLAARVRKLEGELSAIIASPSALPSRSHGLLESLDNVINGASTMDGLVRDAMGDAPPPVKEVMHSGEE